MIDSDDDAAIWQVTDQTIPREDRPNTWHLFPVTVWQLDGGRTYRLLNYQGESVTLLARLAYLEE